MFVLITYLAISIVVSFFSFGKRISFFDALMINIFLTPIVGIISIIKTDKIIKTHHYSMISVCNTCNYEIDDIIKKCPECGEKMHVVFSEKPSFKLA